MKNPLTLTRVLAGGFIFVSGICVGAYPQYSVLKYGEEIGRKEMKTAIVGYLGYHATEAFNQSSKDLNRLDIPSAYKNSTRGHTLVQEANNLLDMGCEEIIKGYINPSPDIDEEFNKSPKEEL